MLEFEMMLFGLIGGMMRLLIGYSKVYDITGYHPPLEHKRALLTIVASLMAGIATPILIKSENPSIALIAGFAGIDLMEALAKGLMKLKTGYAAGFPKSSYSEFGTGKYKPEMSDDYDAAMDYLKRHKTITAADYAKINNVTTSTAYKNLKKLANMKLLIRHKKSGRVYYTAASSMR
ncbi:MAG: hypothetical protein HZB65_03700 [Candidatus Aenigmarchaeota archaeon]|nr:hypothetical protein [Candidatus Aenigmarchaeota archaeon]